MSQCETCAFNKHCETWREPRNRVISQICAAGPLVFFCHQGIDWKNPLTHALSPRALAQTTGVCEGWKREVAARRWPADPDLRLYQRYLAKIALDTAERYLADEATLRELRRDLLPLAQYYHGPRAWQIARMVER